MNGSSKRCIQFLGWWPENVVVVRCLLTKIFRPARNAKFLCFCFVLFSLFLTLLCHHVYTDAWSGENWSWRKNDPFPGDHVIKPRLQGQGACIADLNTDSAVTFHKQLCRERRTEAHWIKASLSFAYQIDYNYYRLTRRGCGCTVEPCSVFVCTTISDTKVQCYFTSTETVWLGTGNPHPRFRVTWRPQEP